MKTKKIYVLFLTVLTLLSCNQNEDLVNERVDSIEQIASDDKASSEFKISKKVSVTTDDGYEFTVKIYADNKTDFEKYTAKNFEIAKVVFDSINTRNNKLKEVSQTEDEQTDLEDNSKVVKNPVGFELVFPDELKNKKGITYSLRVIEPESDTKARGIFNRISTRTYYGGQGLNYTSINDGNIYFRKWAQASFWTKPTIRQFYPRLLQATPWQKVRRWSGWGHRENHHLFDYFVVKVRTRAHSTYSIHFSII